MKRQKCPWWRNERIFPEGDGLAARRLDLVITRTDTRAWLAWKRLVRRLVRNGATCALEAGSGPLH